MIRNLLMLVTALVIIRISLQSRAQKYYYSGGTKVTLSEDTTTVILKGKQKQSYSYIASILHDKIYSLTRHP